MISDIEAREAAELIIQWTEKYTVAYASPPSKAFLANVCKDVYNHLVTQRRRGASKELTEQILALTKELEKVYADKACIEQELNEIRGVIRRAVGSDPSYWED